MRFTKKRRIEVIGRFLVKPDDENTVDAVNGIINEYGYQTKAAILIGKLNETKPGLFRALLIARFPNGLSTGPEHDRP